MRSRSQALLAKMKGWKRVIWTPMLVTAAILTVLASTALAPASAQTFTTPDAVPLTFGMSAEQTSQALGVPLNYIRGRPGNELFLAIPNVKGSALSSRSDGLYLQFRKGRLTGWKGDWGTIRP